MAWFNFNIDLSLGNKNTKQPAPVETPVEVATEVDSEVYDQAIKDAFKEEDAYYQNAFPVAGSKDGYARINESSLPILRPGRSSSPEAFRNFIPAQNSAVATDFPFEHLKFLQQLGMWNRHVSQAVDNIVTLGNTPYEINFGEDISAELSSEMRKHIRSVSKDWYEFSEGANSLINDLLAQLAVSGCISAEGTIKQNISGIRKIVRVDPVNIRFAYDEKKDEHIPLQTVSTGAISSNRESRKYKGHIELNTTTYCYLAMRRFSELPYAIPPFVSAIEDIIIENDMVKNFANMMRRLGMLGFMSVLVTAPKANDGETPEAYKARMSTYLEELRPGVEAGFHKGVTIGFKDKHEFEITGGNQLNATAGDNLLRMVKSLIFSGLKQDPNMHGENFSTTETFGRVILAKMTQQVANYQQTVGEFMARMFKLELLMAGFPVDVVEVAFERAAISDRKHEADTEKIELENTNNLWKMGLIDQQGAAERHDIDEPATPMDEPPDVAAASAKAAADSAAREDETGKPGDLKEAASKVPTDIQLRKLILKIQGSDTIFNYDIPIECLPEDEQNVGQSFVDVTPFKEPEMLAFVQAYVNDIDDRFITALAKAKKEIREGLLELREDPAPAIVQATVMFNLLKNWNSLFVTPMKRDIEKNVDLIYSFYRKDERPFKEASGFSKEDSFAKGKDSFFDIPDPVFELQDIRALEFMEELDGIWLGKFITDPDTIKRINTFIEKELVAEGLSIGRDQEAIKRFTERFINQVTLERYKIRRIVETTANRTRNMGNVMYMNQANVQRYEVVEVGDDRTCPWCFHMHGKVFEIAPTVDKISRLTDDGFENLNEISPFATSRPVEQFKQLDAIALQAQGFDVPSYHPHCRGRVVADL